MEKPPFVFFLRNIRIEIGTVGISGIFFKIMAGMVGRSLVDGWFLFG